jgi:hypothetical protein
LNQGYHTGGCEGINEAIVPSSPKAKLFDVLHKLSTNLQDSNASPALKNKMAPSTTAASDSTRSADKKESELEDKEATTEAWKSQADGARTDVAAASAQITSLGTVLNQEHQFKLQVETACKEKTEKHVVEQKSRKDQLNAVQVAIELVHGNMDALTRYLQGKPPAPPAGLKPGEVVELLNPEAAKLAQEEKQAAKKKLAQEKEEFASIFGGSATGGGTELVQDVTDKKVVADAASVECEAGLIWCETTLQCIDPKILLCASIQVVKGKHFMDSVVQGEKSALVFHDSEAQGQHELKLKLQKERLEYEANKAQRSDQNKKDEEKMKKNLLVRKKTEESEKKKIPGRNNCLEQIATQMFGCQS